MTRGEQEFSDEAWRRANYYGNKACNLIDRIKNDMTEEIQRRKHEEYMNKEAIRQARKNQYVKIIDVA